MPEDTINWSTLKNDIVQDQAGKWYWCDETGDPCGPFNSRDEAVDELNGYCRHLSGDN